MFDALNIPNESAIGIDTCVIGLIVMAFGIPESGGIRILLISIGIIIIILGSFLIYDGYRRRYKKRKEEKLKKKAIEVKPVKFAIGEDDKEPEFAEVIDY